ncbi:spore coat protein [Cohnella pontilimi]|uniref:Spore coat protein n=1 Tax=Cohnella pontilimi TaxID=2564100 RepID=A0A4U0FGA0_9BACL|nr:spore coat protein [Cohnella pontilimi]TJY43947.1 spore coat protein [Cohnella pontilimi]
MNWLVENLTGLNVMTDQVIALDLNMAAKSGIHMYAAAATESATPEVKATLIRHLNESIDFQEKITAYLMQRGFYHPYNMQEQVQLDRMNVQTALQLPS